MKCWILLSAMFVAACGGSDETCKSQMCGEACCAAGEVCFQGACCAPACGERVCGDDGCGGSCGSCGQGEICSVAGQCVAASGELELSRTFIRFSDVAVGHPRTEPLTLTSAGTGPLTLDRVAMRAGAASPFSVLGMNGDDGPEPLPASLAAGESIEIMIEYDPATADADDFDYLEIETNDPDDCPTDDNPCEVQLNGTGAPADPVLATACLQEETCPSGAASCQVILDPAGGDHPQRVALNFCEVPVGTSRQLDVLLSNEGNATLELSELAFDPAHGDPAAFRLLAPAGEEIVALEPGGEQVFSFVYAPVGEGVDSAGMDIHTNDAHLPAEGLAVRLLGVSNEPDIDVHPRAIPFEGVTSGQTATETVTVYNTGTGTLDVDAPIVTGASLPGEFGVAPAGALQIGAAGAADLEVTYAPQDAGVDHGSVILESNDPDEPEVVITLGPVLRPDLDVTPATAVAFTDVPPGGTARQEVILANVGTTDLTVSSIDLEDDPGSPPVFSLDGLPDGFPGTPLVLGPATNTSFEVVFTDDPGLEDESATLAITHDSPNDPVPYLLAVQNEGTPPNHQPVAIIDPQQQEAQVGEHVDLDGSGSYDPDEDDAVTRYRWEFLVKPQDVQGNPSAAVLDNLDQPRTGFTPDLEGTYVIDLVVWDSYNTESRTRSAWVYVQP